MFYVWLIILLPFGGAILNGIWGKAWDKEQVGRVACGSVGLSFLLAMVAFGHLFSWPAANRQVLVPGPAWFTGTGSFEVDFNLLVDPLSMVMLLVVTGVSLVIHLYSRGYMADDLGYSRYFAWLNLFVGFMLVLVLGSSFLLLFVGWEGVGLCSYLLIGFWFQRKSAADAGKKAFIVNRIGDFGFALGVLLIFVTFGTVNFYAFPGSSSISVPGVFDQALEYGHQIAAASSQAGIPQASGFSLATGKVLTTGLLTAICLLLFLGATGKSAQIPLYVWLPDAMEGPTPVSALIHAATMVTAGVYMVARCSVLFALAPAALWVVAIIGALTAIFAASIALVQNDIKRVLAYSTVSQLGYMFLGCGVGVFAAGIFHLMTHAFFKALLFLGAGSVIHALASKGHTPPQEGIPPEQDIRLMGGLKDRMPRTCWTFLLGSLALAGIFPCAGFWSKDEILFGAFSRGGLGIVLYMVGLATAAMTAFYISRLFFKTFWGAPRGEQVERAHESPDVMGVPLMVLGALSVVGGVVGIPGANRIHSYLDPVFADAYSLLHGGHEAGHSLGLEYGLMVLSTVAALGGVALAYFLFVLRPEQARALRELFPRVYQLLLNKYSVDEIYQQTFVEPGRRLMEWIGAFDMSVIDGAVNGVAEGVGSLGEWLRTWQTSYVRTYALSFVAGALVIIAYFVMVAFWS